MNNYSPRINVSYPPNNHLIFEEWFAENYKGCNTDRELLPIFPTSFHVNNGYGEKANELQEYCDKLDPNKKYFIICQYDDGCLVDWKGKDVLEFNMSKTNGVMLPLLCQPHPYKFKGGKKWLANFVGSKTHPIRSSAESLKQHPDYYISFESMPIEAYCSIIYESMFTLCYRGYGANSFRISESVQFGSIPVYISDEFILPPWMDFEDFGVLIKAEDAERVDEILQAIPIETIIEKQDKLSEAYENFFSYEANLKHIINYLESESNAKA